MKSEFGNNNDELRRVLKDLNERFSYIDFLGMTSENGRVGAVAVLTPSQCVTAINENGGKGLWTDNETRIVQAIYDIPRDDDKEVFGDKCKKYIENSIVFEMSVSRNQLSIQVRFPKKLLLGHLNILSEYIEKYGSDIDQIAREYEKRTGRLLINIEGNELRNGTSVMSAIDIMREATFRVPGDMVFTEIPLEDLNIIGFPSKSFAGKLAIQGIGRNQPTSSECKAGEYLKDNIPNLDSSIGGRGNG